MDDSHDPLMAETAAATAGDAPHDEHAAHDVSKHIRAYVLVGLTLIIFTGITVALSYVNFGTQKANVAVAMLVATFKAGLVAAIFMHLDRDVGLLRSEIDV